MPQRAAGGPAGEGTGGGRPVRWARLRRLGRRFRRDRGGVTAVEFGLLAVPFLALLFAIIETALTFLTTQVLESVVETAARQLYTGQFQQANVNTSASALATNFKTEFCKGGVKAGNSPAGSPNYFIVFVNCNTVKVDVQTYSGNSFPSSMPTPFKTVKNAAGQDETVVDPDFGKFSNPAANQIVVIRAVIENPVFVSLLNPNQANLSSGKRLIVATAAFRTEPFN